MVSGHAGLATRPSMIAALVGSVVIGALSPRPPTVATWMSAAVAATLPLLTGRMHMVAVLAPISVIGVARELLERHQSEDR